MHVQMVGVEESLAFTISGDVGNWQVAISVVAVSLWSWCFILAREERVDEHHEQAFLLIGIPVSAL